MTLRLVWMKPVWVRQAILAFGLKIEHMRSLPDPSIFLQHPSKHALIVRRPNPCQVEDLNPGGQVPPQETQPTDPWSVRLSLAAREIKVSNLPIRQCSPSHLHMGSIESQMWKGWVVWGICVVYFFAWSPLKKLGHHLFHFLFFNKNNNKAFVILSKKMLRCGK